MTDTTLAPTDAEILDAAEDFRSQYMHGGTTFDEFDEIGFARAVLAKWGAPALASSEPAAVLASGPVAELVTTAHGFETTLSLLPGHFDLPYGTHLLYAAPQPAAQALDAQRLTKASKDISTVLRVEGMDLEIGSRKLLREAREAIDAAIAGA